MSSFSFQPVTRVWMKHNPNALMISVDYSLLDKDQSGNVLNKFPKSLDDCWQIYMYIITILPFQINRKINKLIITGDSAGGNMSTALYIKCINDNVRKPDGLLLCYPALNLDRNEYLYF